MTHKKLVSLFLSIFLVAGTFAEFLSAYSLAPPVGIETDLFPHKEIFDSEIDLSLGDPELVALSMIDEIEQHPDKRIFFNCLPKTKKQADIAMQLGFVTPRTDEELERGVGDVH